MVAEYLAGPKRILSWAYLPTYIPTYFGLSPSLRVLRDETKVQALVDGRGLAIDTTACATRPSCSGQTLGTRLCAADELACSLSASVLLLRRQSVLRQIRGRQKSKVAERQSGRIFVKKKLGDLDGPHNPPPGTPDTYIIQK